MEQIKINVIPFTKDFDGIWINAGQDTVLFDFIKEDESIEVSWKEIANLVRGKI